MTVTTAAVYYANFGNGSSTGYFAIPVWHTSWTPTVGTITRQVAPTASNARCFICTTGGAVGGIEPTWVVTKGAKTTDGSAVWFECSGFPGLNGDLTNTPLSSQNRSGSQAVGNIITNNTQDHYFLCTTAGTTGASEPTYNTTLGATTTDNTCTWTCIGPVTSFTTSWAASYPYIGNATGSGKLPVGGTLYVSSAHAETQAATITISGLSGGQIICVQDAGSIPPTASNITTGASVTVTGSSHSIALSNTNTEYNGLSFSGTSIIQFGGSATFQRCRNCAVTAGGADITNTNLVELINTPIALAAGASGFALNSGQLIWRDTPTALSAPGGWPISAFTVGGTGSALFEGVDLSAFAGTQLFSSSTTTRVTVSRCKLPSTSLSAAITVLQGCVIDFIDCDAGGNTYNTQRSIAGLTQAMSTSVVATSGASDGTTAYSWSLTGTTQALTWSAYAECMPIYVWNSVTGTNRTVSIQAAYVGTTLPDNSDIWLDVRYFGTASSTFASVATTGLATILSSPTSWSSSGATTWGSAAPARSNSHAYSLGNIIGVSSSGSVTRAFVCTTAGTSASSLPGAYATAGDGTAVTDGTAHFTSVNPFVLTVTLSSPQPAEAGYFICYINVASTVSSSYPTFFVDPLATLS